MRILITSDTYLPLVGGAEIYIENLVKYLRKKNNKVVLFTTLISEEKHGESDIIRVSWPGRNLYKLIKFVSLISKLLRDCDLVYTHYNYRLSALVSILARLKRKPIINFSHGLGTILESDSPWLYKLYRFISLKSARGVIATSIELAEIVKKFNNNVIIATGVDWEKIKDNLKKEEVKALQEKYKNKKIILTVRRLVPKNGIQYLIETMPHIIEKDKSVKYLVVGTGRMMESLKKRVEELKIEDFVEFLGEIKNEDVYKYMAIASIVVFPSSAEAMSLACIEAMMIGTPVVATKIGGLIQLIGENNERGVLVDLFNTAKSTYYAPETDSIAKEKYKDFGGKIINVLEKKEIKEEIVLGAKKYALENYNWQSVMDKILEFSLK